MEPGMEPPPDDVPPQKNPSPPQPIKRRPIVPGDKIGRPRIILDLITKYNVSSFAEGRPLLLTVRSMQTLEERVETIFSAEEYIEIMPMDDTYEYLLIFEGEGIYFEEMINIEE